MCHFYIKCLKAVSIPGNENIINFIYSKTTLGCS